MRRRGLIGGMVLLPAMARARTALADRCLAAIHSALAALPAGPVLLRSYPSDSGAKSGFDLTQGTAAYVYDNALAGLALAAAGDWAGAARIGQALALAQAHDRFWRDGRLRNAYRAGPMTLPASLPGWWDPTANRWQEDPYQAGSQTGPLAWAMLLWTRLQMTEPASRAAGWLNTNLRANAGYYGGFYGFEPEPLKLTWQSTEQNTDLFAAFSRLGRNADAADAARFVHAMFSAAEGWFLAGTAPDGSRNPLLAADAGIWPYLASVGSAQSAATAIAALRQGGGVGFSAASHGLWPEGTAFAGLALAAMSDPRASEFLASVEAQLSPSGFVYAAATDRLATGLNTGPAIPGQSAMPFEYFHRPALAPTAWAVLSALEENPLST